MNNKDVLNIINEEIELYSRRMATKFSKNRLNEGFNKSLENKSTNHGATKIVLKESELIDLIEEIVLEQKDKQPEGLAITNKMRRETAKDSDSYMKDVNKKMKKHVGKIYDQNPKSFPKSNGGDRFKYQPSEAVDEYIENFAYAPGLENISYDEIEPNEDWVTDNIKGSSRTGNNPKWANAEETSLGEKINNKRKNNLYNKEKNKSYDRVKQPVDVSGGDKKNGALNKMMSKLESVKSNPTIIEELNRAKQLIGFNY